jgi:hypothetical protein
MINPWVDVDCHHNRHHLIEILHFIKVQLMTKYLKHMGLSDWLIVGYWQSGNDSQPALFYH